MANVIVVGAQWGDEGKGKIIDLLASKAKHIVRAQGGNNAGHTVLVGKEEYKLHLLPSGILYPDTQCYIGAGTVIDPEILVREIHQLSGRGVACEGRLWISSAAHVIFPYHRTIDHLLEAKKGERSIGTTGCGIGPCYSDKANRLGIRVCELIRTDIFPVALKSVLNIKNEELSNLYSVEKVPYDEILVNYTKFAELLTPFVANVEELLSYAIDKNERILLEGAQGTFLDLNTGTYPFVTSSHTTAGGICSGAGIGPSRIDHTIGVVKAYTTRVGNGPLPSEISEDEKFLDHHVARELGTTTGRKRRIGWFDAILAKTAVRLNGLDSIAVTKLDVLDDLKMIKVCVGYSLNGKRLDHLPSLEQDWQNMTPIFESVQGWNTSTANASTYHELPQRAKEYLKLIESYCGVPISIISLGPERAQTIFLRDIFTAKDEFRCC